MQNLKFLELRKIVLIGASTGGPGQIQKIIDTLPKLNRTSIIIAQHMGLDFMQSFAKRVQETSLNPISIPEDGEYFKNGNIYICKGDTEICTKTGSLVFKQHSSQLNSFNPNIDLIFNSFNKLVKDLEILCVILTGIGNDGVNACKNLSESGVRSITESHSSAIVDGMPARVRDSVVGIEVDDISEIIKKIREFSE